jgi:hypothetical protein
MVTRHATANRGRKSRASAVGSIIDCHWYTLSTGFFLHNHSFKETRRRDLLTRAALTNAQSRVADNRGTIAETIERLATIASAKDGVREDEGLGRAARTGVLVAYGHKDSAGLSCFERSGCGSGEGREEGDGEINGGGKHI